MIGSVAGSTSSAPYLTQLFKKLDANTDGSIDQAELTSVSANRASIPQSTTDAKGIINRIDTDSDGKIAESEFESFAISLRQNGSGTTGEAASAEGGPHGMPPGGGHRTPRSTSGTSASSKSTGSTGATCDPKDANEDGVVSLQEETQYDIAHPSAASMNNPVTSYNSSGADSSHSFSAIIDTFA
jgi:hypothetical protein